MSQPVQGKVTSAHLQRNAYLYVRQSTLQQVIENTESSQRQYQLRQRAIGLGWRQEQIVVIDCDQGQSGASSADREGFQQLVSEVGMGRAGIVMGLEVSRLARNSADWHRLLEICALSDTLILDEDGVYEPGHFNDRLLLGMKGTMSEAELHVLRARLQGGLLNKARRGELEIRLPTGFVYDESGRPVLDPDKQVRETIQLFFETFRRCGSAGATVKAFQDRGLRFPSRPPYGPHKGEVVWGQLRYSRALQILNNVRYAGAFAFGRTRTRKTLEGRYRSNRLPREQWAVLIQNAHDGYITWDELEENRRRLRDNGQRLRGKGGTTPPREGCALLQGLVVCGVCGSHMTIAYHVRGGRRIPCYVCQRSELRWAKSHCQRVTGACIDDAVGALVVHEMNPVALETAIEVQRELEARAEQVDRLRYRHVERARYEAEAARRRYMRVDPDNRLVADELEAIWNDKLRNVKTVQEEYERQRRHDGLVIDDAQRERISSLAEDFPRLWRASTTSDRDRKRMIRLIVEDVTLVREHARIRVHVRFRGGRTESLEVTPPLKSWEKRLTSPKTVEETDRLLDDHPLDEIVDILNRRGHRSGTGQPITRVTLKNLCTTYKLKTRKQRLLARGLVSRREMANHLDVSPQTIARWHQAGRLRAQRCGSNNQHLFELPTADEMAQSRGGPQ
jgi:DNA invertase Pin-like site-specific DNA recombinase